MKENKKTEKVDFKVFPPDAIVKLEISGDFYQRLQMCLQDYIYKVSQDPTAGTHAPENIDQEAVLRVFQELAEAQTKNQNKDPEGEMLSFNHFCIETLLILCHSIEQTAEKTGKIKTEVVEIPAEMDGNPAVDMNPLSKTFGSSPGN